MPTYQIHIQGQVQGVGFRPFIYQLAQRFSLTGQVSNRSDGVRVLVNASQPVAQLFLEAILEEHPPIARITNDSLQEVASQEFRDFSIVHSESTHHRDVLLTPDLGLCPACRSELNQKDNRRYHYAFTNCTHCGPRYSIIKELPYDRATTAMAPFELCVDCQQEYDDPTDRRYYAQANTCPQCPITFALYDAQGKLITNHPGTESGTGQPSIINQVVEKLRGGAIIAIKGVGGYLLVCDATNAEAVSTLRKRKHRPTKPFAVMYPSLDQLRQDIPVSKEVKKLLTSSVSPIVLLPVTDAGKQRLAFNRLALQQIAPNLQQVGVVLPYAPLFEILMQEVGKPVVATSANISGSPIVYTEEAAERQLSSLVDFRLTYNREIVIPQDDSVVRFNPEAKQKIILRRSRGMAPTLVLPEPLTSDKNILAMGSDLKSTFAYTHCGNQYVSQYLGDLASYDSQQSYRNVLSHLLELFDAQPEVILTDQHPQYFSKQLGKQLAKEFQVSVETVQHHQAHFAAVLGENQLIDADESVLGVIWDGTGLGDDGQIWGGEFFMYQNYSFERIAHLEYFPHLMGDKMAHEPRLSALSLTNGSYVVQQKFSTTEWKHYTQQVNRADGFKTSSVGRLFDGVASILGLIDRATYEGEAALLLETVANDYIERYGYGKLTSYFSETEIRETVPYQSLIDEILRDKDEHSNKFIAARFHYSLADCIQKVAQQQGTKKIAMSGGVFQNALLVDMVHKLMADDYELFFHHQLSPNDENISFGQLAYYQIQQKAHVPTVTRGESMETL
ncbi:carbamoyltransferase HypF [Tunicatimonas pelagia]|uniref:carbamoyltransferase HypF n=1 Tax=Tunicatimonas pelagia TaxID=931531 RepID=UPI0026665325|nr:carbamoyltransferase HypF [Tunicatimonas pelagia]WKN41328.1 carbamoyltransferase HypF [Tunicatimonas pelagia]